MQGLSLDFGASRVSFRHTVALVREGTLARVGFVALAAGLAATVGPLAPLLIWGAALLLWEWPVRRWLEVRFVLSLPESAPREGFARLALINGFGAALYAALPFLLWSTGSTVGAVLSTAWIAGVAIHLFVYFADNPALLIANGAPTLLATVFAPILAPGEITMTGIVGAVSSVAIFMAASRFIVDRNAILQQLTQESAARQAAENLARAKSQFLAVMSHELRTPLNAVIGYAEILEEDVAEAGSRDDARKIAASGRGLLALINDILDMSKLEAGQMCVRAEEVMIADLLDAAAADVAGLAKANGVTLTTHVSQGLGAVRVDPVKMRQCLVNLASNACKFSPGGVVRLSAWREEGRLCVAVRDNGVGIAAKDLAVMFEPFTQADGAHVRKTGGTGLGLAITRKLARLMGGDVIAESTLGRGSTFTLKISEGAPERALAA